MGFIVIHDTHLGSLNIQLLTILITMFKIQNMNLV